VGHLDPFRLTLLPLAKGIADTHSKRHVVDFFQPLLGTLAQEFVVPKPRLKALTKVTIRESGSHDGKSKREREPDL